MEHRIHVQPKGTGRRQEPKPNKQNNSNRLSLSVSQINKSSFWHRHQSLPIHVRSLHYFPTTLYFIVIVAF